MCVNPYYYSKCYHKHLVVSPKNILTVMTDDPVCKGSCV